VLARHGAPPTGDDKTSFCFAFTTADRAGTLAGALMELAKAGISMTKVESRPSRMLLGQYIFRRLRSDDAREGAGRPVTSALPRRLRIVEPKPE